MCRHPLTYRQEYSHLLKCCMQQIHHRQSTVMLYTNTLNYCFVSITRIFVAHYQFTVSIFEIWYNLILHEKITYFNLKSTKITKEHIKLKPKENEFVHLK